jgi:site-specific DNA-methyltransferase (adenine-specific)
MRINQIIVSDALEFLQGLPPASVQLFLFSPPYNLGNSSGGGMPGKQRLGHYPADAGLGRRGGSFQSGKWSGGALAGGYESSSDSMPHDKYVAWQHEILLACWRALPGNGAIYYNHKPRILDGELVEPRDYVPSEIPLRQRVIWARAGGVNFSPAFYVPTYEEILILAKPGFRLKSKGASGVGDVWTVPQVSGTWHPAPFPLPLAERVIETVRPVLVCDPFMGSGTTAKAARRYGIDWIGCDKSAKYAERAQREIDAIQPLAAAMIADQEEMFV